MSDINDCCITYDDLEDFSNRNMKKEETENN